MYSVLLFKVHQLGLCLKNKFSLIARSQSSAVLRANVRKSESQRDISAARLAVLRKQYNVSKWQVRGECTQHISERAGVYIQSRLGIRTLDVQEYWNGG